MMSRRQFLYAGAAAVGATVLGSAGLAVSDLARADDSALNTGPRAEWETASGTRRVILAGALAPSSHNTQPWKFGVSDDGISLHGDSSRTMGAADPRLRELHVSLGCALENMAIASAAAGVATSVEFVGSPPGPLHHALLRPAPDAAPRHARLERAIPLRRTNRAPFDASAELADETLDALAALADGGVRIEWLTSPADRSAFTDLTVAATRRHVADKAMQAASHRWYRMTRSAAERHADGVTIDGANLGLVAATLLRVAPPTPDAFDAGWAKATRETHCATAPAFGLVVCGRTGERSQWVQAGRVYERMQLAACLEDVALHPISQALALRDVEVDRGVPAEFASGLQALAGDGEVVLAFRIGYPQRDQAASLRRAPAVD